MTPVLGLGQFGLPEIIARTEFDNPRQQFLIDVDQNGTLDVLVMDASMIGYYANDGNGGFSRVHYLASTGRSIWVAALGDLDGDGDEDLIVAKYLTSTEDSLYWYVNNGPASFGPATALASIGKVGAIATGDLNGDGRVDIAVSSPQTDLVYWYENDPLGSFNAVHILSTDLDGPYELALADLDVDGDLDAVIMGVADNKVACIANDGSGTFTLQLILGTQTSAARRVLVEDVDGDGIPDVVANGGSPGLNYFRNDGGWNFQPGQLLGMINAGSAIGSADLNGDGHLDIWFCETSYGNPYWFANNGTGGFSSWTLMLSTPISTPVAVLVFGDLNGDQLPDMCFRVDYSLFCCMNNGSGVFAGDMIEYMQIVTNADASDAADIDGDGDMDLVVCIRPIGYSSKLVWLEHVANDSAWVEHVIRRWDDVPSGIGDFIAVDYDGDLDMDLLVYERFPTGDTYLRCYINDGNGNFSSTGAGFSFGMGAGYFKRFDLNSDGTDDIVCLDDNYTVYWIGIPGGGLMPLNWFSTVGYGQNVGDVDGDGDVDFVELKTYVSPWQFLIKYNNGSQVFTTQTVATFSAPVSYQSPRSIELVDMDMDGDLDVIFDAGALGIKWLENGASWSVHDLGSLGHLSPNGFTGDFDLDGDIDLVYRTADNGMAFWANDGTGNSGAIVPIMSDAPDSYTYRLVDVDQDGIRDLYVNWNRRTIQILRGDDNIILSGSVTGPESVQLFPNPSHGETNIRTELPLDLSTSISVLDPQGRLLRSFAGNGRREMLLDLSGFSSGLYLVSVHSPGKATRVGRLVIE